VRGARCEVRGARCEHELKVLCTIRLVITSLLC